MAKKVRKASKKAGKAKKVRPHKLSEAKKKNFTLTGIHPQTGKHIVCRYDPATKQWDDCDD